jgi:hypothetical protein
MLHSGSEQGHGAESARTLWEGRKSSATLRRIPPGSRGIRCPWNTAPPEPCRGGVSDITGSGLRLTSPPRPRRATCGTCMAPAAGACRPKRPPPWEHGCRSCGGGFVPVARPARATPAHTPPTLCAVSGPWTTHGTGPRGRGTGPVTTDKPCSTFWPTRRGRDQRSSARGTRRSRRRRPWPRGAH